MGRYCVSKGADVDDDDDDDDDVPKPKRVRGMLTLRSSGRDPRVHSPLITAFANLVSRAYASYVLLPNSDAHMLAFCARVAAIPSRA